MKNFFVILLGLVIVSICFSVLLIFLFKQTRPRALLTTTNAISTPTSTPTVTNSIYGANVEMSQLVPGSTKYVIDSNGQDLIDTAAKLGINMIRITNATYASKDKRDGLFTKDQWDAVLNKMQKKGIRALILIESPTIYQKKIPTDTYLSFLQNYLLNNDILSHSNIYGVDLYNEPTLTDENVATLQTASEMIKNRYPKTQLTVGWWAVATTQKDDNNQQIYSWDNYTEGKKLAAFTDFYSVHLYGFDKKSLGVYHNPYSYTVNFLTSVKTQLETTKPILIEEFGAANGDAVSDQETIGSPELQANTYAGVYQALIDMKEPQFVGTVAYQLYSRSNTTPDAWALVKDKGAYIFPAGYVLQKYATGKSDQLVSVPLSPVPDDTMLTLSADNTTINLQKNDIVGLKLGLIYGDTYSIVFSNPAMFATSEELNYDSDRSKYYAVLHATQTGEGSISVKNSSGSQVFNVNVVIE